jgi:cyclic-di-AMP phosphodiesterase PgpH
LYNHVGDNFLAKSPGLDLSFFQLSRVVMKPFQSLPRQSKKPLIRRYNQVWLMYWLWIIRNTSGSYELFKKFLSQSLVSSFKKKVEPFSSTQQPHPPKKQPSPAKRVRHPLLLAFTVVSLTSVMGQKFYNAPTLDVGKKAPQTIYAPATVSIEDAATTEENRKIARTGAIAVLMLNQEVNQKIYQDLQQVLDQGTELRRLAGNFPYVSTADLSLTTQAYLQQAEEWEWRAVLEAVEATGYGSKPSSRLNSNTRLSNSDQRRAASELVAYRQATSTNTFTALTQKISQARWKYSVAVSSLPQPTAPNTDVAFDALLFQIPDRDWQTTYTVVRQLAERILAQGIAEGLPKSILKDAVAMQVRTIVPASAHSVATNVLMATLQPNLIKDEEQTRARAERAAEEVKPEVVSIQKGEEIVWVGQTITRSDFVLLDHFGLSRRGINWLGLVGYGLLVSGAVTVFWLVGQRFYPSMRQRDYILVGLLTVSTPLLLALGVPAPNLPLVGLLVGNFYGSVVGATAVGLLTIVLPVGTVVSGSALVSSAIGGLVGSLIAGRLRSREELALLGGAVGITQGIVYLTLNVVISPVWYMVLGAAAIQSLAGLAWSIVALGISPYLEHLFDLVTPIRLVELTNSNRPLLKRLASEAPGTFQHTLFVSTLAEAAARALGCNVELIRAGTLYHDIGKLHDPLGFIENQMGGPNKHDAIDDPYKSADIIKKHVSEGLVMARKHRLPKAIQAFIPEHQGTMLIAYFYHQAQQRSQASSTEDATNAVREADFRYDGPIPQSKETGILMLADSCEAALRSLKDATYEEALAMINKILRARWQDNQLVDSGLTREEMTQIANIFVQVWQQFNHQRIAYPKLSPPKPAGVNS